MTTREDEPTFEDEPVTAIIPYSEEFTPRPMLDEAIASVETQVDVEAEPLVVEDETRRGPAWARNQGLERADTRLVGFLDADDYWKEDKLRRQCRRMSETAAGVCVQGTPGRSLAEFRHGVLAGSIDGLTSTILIDTHRTDARFDETLPRREDHLFMIEAAEDAGVCFVEDLYVERLTEQGMSARVEKSPEQAEAFFERVVERVPAATGLEDEFFRNAYVDAGRYRHHRGRYRGALRCFARSLDHGPTVEAVGAIGLTLLAASVDVPRRIARRAIPG